MRALACGVARKGQVRLAGPSDCPAERRGPNKQSERQGDLRRCRAEKEDPVEGALLEVLGRDPEVNRRGSEQQRDRQGPTVE